MATKKKYTITKSQKHDDYVRIRPTSKKIKGDADLRIGIDACDDLRPYAIGNGIDCIWLEEQQANWLAEHLLVAIAERNRRKAGVK